MWKNYIHCQNTKILNLAVAAEKVYANLVKYYFWSLCEKIISIALESKSLIWINSSVQSNSLWPSQC